MPRQFRRKNTVTIRKTAARTPSAAKPCHPKAAAAAKAKQLGGGSNRPRQSGKHGEGKSAAQQSAEQQAEPPRRGTRDPA